MQEFNEDYLQEYLDGTLDEDSRRAVEAHLATSPAARAQLAEMETLFAGLEALPEMPLAVDLSAGVVTRIRQETPALSRVEVAVSTSLPRWLWLLLLSQIVGAVFLLGNRWSLLLDGLVNGRQLAADWLSSIQLPSLTLIAQLWANFTELLQTPTLPNLSIDLPTSQWGLLLALALIIWLAGNQLLFTDSAEG
ncbi:hypothetical protein MNBD_CHLOROFLEXI01-3351 [hydrothermal vent metagenome]|uniref:Putative zinc-finger domain-containing protein n=1 Tax=hydrothermal vent metagenome TaxID=652676 RepID=A0A3B0V368_9ZZZZ